LSLAGYLDDLYSFDLVTKTWVLISVAGGVNRPSASYQHGITSADGKLYVYGGWDGNGDLSVTQ
jgi:hypothetical protein